MKRVFTITYISFIFLLFLNCTSAQSNTTSTITVTGNGHHTVVVNYATVSIAIQNQAKLAQSAQQVTANAESAVIQMLKSLNVTNLRTDTISLFPQYNYSDNAQSLVGFTSTVSLSYEISPDNVGSSLDKVITAGANRIDSVSSLVSEKDTNTAYQFALAGATNDALSKAEIVTKQLGMCLGKPEQVTIEPSTVSSLPTRTMTAMQTQASSTFIPQSQDISATITVTYAITAC